MSEGEFEAKVIRKNDSEKGLFITLEITGDDYYGAVSQFRPGTLLRLEYEELDSNTGAPKELASTGSASERAGTTAAQQSGEETAALSKPRVEPLAIASTDSGQALPAGDTGGAGGSSHKPRRPFHEMKPSERCALMCMDKAFQKWIQEPDEASADRAVKLVIGIKSKRELDSDVWAACRWEAIQTRFQAHLTTLQHAETFR